MPERRPPICSPVRCPTQEAHRAHRVCQRGLAYGSPGQDRRPTIAQASIRTACRFARSILWPATACPDGCDSLRSRGYALKTSKWRRRRETIPSALPLRHAWCWGAVRYGQREVCAASVPALSIRERNPLRSERCDRDRIRRTSVDAARKSDRADRAKIRSCSDLPRRKGKYRCNNGHRWACDRFPKSGIVIRARVWIVQEGRLHGPWMSTAQRVHESCPVADSVLLRPSVKLARNLIPTGRAYRSTTSQDDHENHFRKNHRRHDRPR